MLGGKACAITPGPLLFLLLLFSILDIFVHLVSEGQPVTWASTQESFYTKGSNAFLISCNHSCALETEAKQFQTQDLYILSSSDLAVISTLKRNECMRKLHENYGSITPIFTDHTRYPKNTFRNISMKTTYCKASQQ